jgi:hypothetical protein
MIDRERPAAHAAPGDRSVEFVSFDEVADLLDDNAIDEVPDGPDRVYLRMADSDGVVRLHLACPASTCKPLPGATVIKVDKERLAKVFEHVMHLLHLNQCVLIPVGKWRRVFDAVAFSLAKNEAWQEIDATATVE